MLTILKKCNPPLHNDKSITKSFTLVKPSEEKRQTESFIRLNTLPKTFTLNKEDSKFTNFFNEEEIIAKEILSYVKEKVRMK